MKQLHLFTATFDKHPVVGLAVLQPSRGRRAAEAFYTLSGAPIAKPSRFHLGTFLGEFGTPDEFWELVEDLQDFGDADRKLAGKPIESLVADDDDDDLHAVPQLPKRRRGKRSAA
jgi:hypothetical protein